MDSELTDVLSKSIASKLQCHDIHAGYKTCRGEGRVKYKLNKQGFMTFNFLYNRHICSDSVAIYVDMPMSTHLTHDQPCYRCMLG